MLGSPALDPPVVSPDLVAEPAGARHAEQAQQQSESVHRLSPNSRKRPFLRLSPFPAHDGSQPAIVPACPGSARPWPDSSVARRPSPELREQSPLVGLRPALNPDRVLAPFPPQRFGPLLPCPNLLDDRHAAPLHRPVDPLLDEGRVRLVGSCLRRVVGR